MNTQETSVQHVFARAGDFPSLSLMSRPITPAPPRLRFFPGTGTNGKWRCRVELRDIAKRKGPGMLSFSDYSAPGAEGWGSSRERAYNAWRSKWRALFERTT